MKTSISAPPPPPAAVDPGQASLDFINKMADPELQGRILAAEQQFRPQYTALNLQEQEQYLRGVGGQAGAIDILNQITPQLVGAQETADRLQRDADIRALQSQSGGYLSALMQANPQMFAQLEAARAMGGKTDLFGGLESAIQGTQRFGDVNITPTQAALIGAAPTMQAQGYNAATMQAAMLGAAPTIEAQGYNAQGYDAARAQRVADVAAQTIGQGALGQSLYGQALEAAPTAASDTFRRRAAEMAVSTGQLSPEELRNAQQATREAFAARGLEMSNQAIAAEAMSRAEAVRQRQAQDIQQAAALNQAYLADLNASRGFATGVYGQDLGRSQMNQEATLRAALANQATGAQMSLADQAAINQASQFGAAAQNQANQFAAAAQNAASQGNAQLAAQFQMANQQAQMQANAANQAAINQAGQFGAQAANVAGQSNLDAAMRTALANQATQTQVGLTNQEMMANLGQANRAFQASQQQQGIANLGLLGQARQGELAANRAFQQNLVGMYGAAFDPMATVLGRPSGALGVGQQQQGMASGMMQAMGGQVFDPNAGINLALQNQANLGNYQASTYGARAGAQGAILGGLMQGLGSAAGGFLGRPPGCWVAREVYGEFNPMWLVFREWLYTKAPKWFLKLYEKYGERFADWISDKPRIKKLIRKWMDSRIKSL